MAESEFSLDKIYIEISQFIRTCTCLCSASLKF